MIIRQESAPHRRGSERDTVIVRETPEQRRRLAPPRAFADEHDGPARIGDERYRLFHAGGSESACAVLARRRTDAAHTCACA